MSAMCRGGRRRLCSGRCSSKLHLPRQSAKLCAIDLLPLSQGGKPLIKSRLLRIRLRQKALQSLNMDLHPADDGIARALDLIAQTTGGNFDRLFFLSLSLA